MILGITRYRIYKPRGCQQLKWTYSPSLANITCQVGLLGGNIRCDIREPNREHLMHLELSKRTR